MTPPADFNNDFEKWLEQTLRRAAPAPSQELLERVMAVPAQPIIETRFDFAALFTFWQKTLAGGAVFASLMAGVLFGQLQETSSGELDWTEDDVPGLTYSVGDLGDMQ